MNVENHFLLRRDSWWMIWPSVSPQVGAAEDPSPGFGAGRDLMRVEKEPHVWLGQGGRHDVPHTEEGDGVDTENIGPTGTSSHWGLPLGRGVPVAVEKR